MVVSLMVLDFACGSSGCVLWLCVVVVCCGCALWLCVCVSWLCAVVVCCGCVFVAVCCGCVCGCVLVTLFLAACL